MDKTTLLEDLQAFYAQLLAEPKSPFNTAIKLKVETCHRRLSNKEQSDLAMASEVNELLHEMSSLEHRYKTKLSEPAKALLKPIADGSARVLTKASIMGLMTF